MKINPELSEVMGIVAGDGNLFKTKQGGYRLIITGHSEDDYKYLTTHVAPLLMEFGINSRLWKYPTKNAIRLTAYSKKLFNFLLQHNFPNGAKTNLRIPNIVKQNKILSCRFLRGLLDTDFSVYFKKGPCRKLNSYPIVATTFSNKLFVKDISKLFSMLEIRANVYRKLRNYYGKTLEQYQIEIYGTKNFDKIMKFVGFRNPKHLTKIALWQKFGYCLPHTSYLQRHALLSK